MRVCIVALIRVYLGLTRRASEEFAGSRVNITEVLAGLLISRILGATFGASLTFIARRLVRP